MAKQNSKTNRRNWLTLGMASVALFLAGCNVKLVDLTPSTLKANPSHAYSITAQINVKNNAVIAGSLAPEIVIDGKAHTMSRVPGSESLWEYDYKMPPGRNRAVYYYLVRFQRKTASAVVTKEIYTEPKTFSVENRYSVELEVNRAPVGTRVAVLGRGFTRDDKVIVGGTPALTQVESATSIAFYVPSLPQGRNYNVSVLGLNGELSAGTLRIDASQIHVSHPPLNMTEGRRLPITFTIPSEAPPGGLLITVTTDVPDSVIMPEVIIPAGTRSTTIRVEGGEAGSGNLYVELDGYSEVVIPVTVR